VLIPDFKGSRESLQAVMQAGPDILNHNLETVERLQRRVRVQARYDRSLEVLRMAAGMNESILTKSGIMLGLGEAPDEVRTAIRDLRQACVSILTIGQYLRPSSLHLPMERYATPEEFAEYRDFAQALGFRHVESGPLVRSSYHADDQVDRAMTIHKECDAEKVTAEVSG
jgi:lipoic acid synthetase